MILNQSSLICGGGYMSYKASHTKLYYPISASFPRALLNDELSEISDSSKYQHRLKTCYSLELPLLSAASSPLVRGDFGSLSHIIPTLPMLRRQSLLSLRASKDSASSFQYPAMTKKPRWWWRCLACLPYLIPLHWTWFFSATAYHLHPFLETLEFLTYPFLGVLGRLLIWFQTAYHIVTFLMVRRKVLPHFLRYHMMMGLLLGIVVQVMGTVKEWMPLSFYWGKIGMHFWTAVTFAFLFTVLECMRCALGGMYADAPFFSLATYMQVPVGEESY